MPGRHARKHRTPVKKISSVFFLAGALVTGTLLGLHKFPKHTIHAAHSQSQTSRLQMNEPYQLLILGTDARPGDKNGNSDVLMIMRVDPEAHRIALLSIPRDTQVAFPDGRYRKINESMQIGGATLSEKVVEKLIGLPIDGYVVAHFDSVVQLVNLLGGITLHISKPMHYDTGDKVHHRIWLNPGLQHVDGEDALGFVRFRHDELGDIGRTERQQEFIQAIYQQILQPKNLLHLPEISKIMWNSVDTDLSMWDVIKMIGHMEQYKNYSIIHETLPGSFHNPNPLYAGDLSYWVVNPQQAKFEAHRFLLNGICNTQTIQNPSETNNWKPPHH
ncbi:LCP family protein [Alicyclobacillus tolerans]|uniref:Transcriptional attenuator, LytR family n=2 Tax=Alicyclobacillus tolerans TaxID=90970 RepID=A0A1M6MEZ8_9BACL|nr:MULTISPECIES: LCP family protein [Alicyclobacillus]MDP9728233.1 LCP family protein required for cell wall assembly [Alicyclobacillus tengchongensis]SHJ81920.1 transcriptional attenuator, LytR family [Alicyclobacillus montanus]